MAESHSEEIGDRSAPWDSLRLRSAAGLVIAGVRLHRSVVVEADLIAGEVTELSDRPPQLVQLVLNTQEGSNSGGVS